MQLFFTMLEVVMARVEIRLTDDEKSNWKSYCKSQGVSESCMMRQLIKHSVPDIAYNESFKQAKTNKITIRLSSHEFVKLESQAKAEGYINPTSWVKASVTASLQRNPIITDSEVNALRESNRQLAAIGRNLNQIARVLNIEFRESNKVTKDMIEMLTKRLNSHRTKVNKLIHQSYHRWQLELEEASNE
ncbi:plasmid mobilization relaxosome protein MobC [Parashewanella curva]|uniref:Plasmid mobilization relaxosome protein MobC n=2 Tax=Parashewanella curva TaxID=2338552 RepID=A0A3L8PUA8_9GAMM|nr:plasmid mobilization relaxosome protein MobC [Parashewanella curva]